MSRLMPGSDRRPPAPSCAAEAPRAGTLHPEASLDRPHLHRGQQQDDAVTAASAAKTAAGNPSTASATTHRPSIRTMFISSFQGRPSAHSAARGLAGSRFLD